MVEYLKDGAKPLINGFSLPALFCYVTILVTPNESYLRELLVYLNSQATTTFSSGKLSLARLLIYSLEFEL